MARVAPEVQATLTRLHEIVKQRDAIQQDPSLDVIEKTEQVSILHLSVHRIWGIDFVVFSSD